MISMNIEYNSMLKLKISYYTVSYKPIPNLLTGKHTVGLILLLYVFIRNEEPITAKCTQILQTQKFKIC